MTSVNINENQYKITVTEGDTDLVTVTEGNTDLVTISTVKDSDFLQTGTGAVARTVDSKLKDVISVLDFGAKGDGITDDTAAIQAAIDSIKGTEPTGGGVVRLPKGIYRTNGPLIIYSNVCLMGDGLTRTYIKPLDNATFNQNQAVIQSKDFDTTADQVGTGQWDYYPDNYTDTLVMGVGLRELCIDGNKKNLNDTPAKTNGVDNAIGVAIYGGKWNFFNLAVINTASHGIWTEAGIPGSSTSGDDLHDFLNMHESFSSNIYIANADNHGWLYRGPNDSSIGDVQIKTCKWGGLFQESTTNNSIGNLEIRSLHTYACDCNFTETDNSGATIEPAMITLANANVNFIYVDASKKNGLLLNNTATVIDQVLVVKNNEDNAGNYFGVIVDRPAQINCIRNADIERTTGTDGGLLKVTATGESSIIGQVRSSVFSTTTIAQIGIQLEGSCMVGSYTSGNYLNSSKALVIKSSKTIVTMSAKNCATAVSYETAGRNILTLNAISCTTEINYVVNPADNDYILITSDTEGRSELNTGKLISSQVQRRVHDITGAINNNEYTPDLNTVSFLKTVNLTTNLEFKKPTNATEGDILEIFIQLGDATPTITFEFTSDPNPLAGYKHSYTNTNIGNFKRINLGFVFIGGIFVQTYNSGWI
tara:strand:- start:272 stop:2218 length:1947 start_codon:yes stop_codon:yes gene_type:complete